MSEYVPISGLNYSATLDNDCRLSSERKTVQEGIINAVKKMAFYLQERKYKRFAQQYFSCLVKLQKEDKESDKLFKLIERAEDDQDENLIAIIEQIDLLMYFVELLEEQKATIVSQEAIVKIEDCFALLKEHGTGAQSNQEIWEWKKLKSSLKLECPTVQNHEEDDTDVDNEDDNSSDFLCRHCGHPLSKHNLLPDN